MSRKITLSWLQERGLDGKAWVEKVSAGRKGFPAPRLDLRHSSRPDPADTYTYVVSLLHLEASGLLP